MKIYSHVWDTFNDESKEPYIEAFVKAKKEYLVKKESGKDCKRPSNSFLLFRNSYKITEQNREDYISSCDSA